VSVPRATSAEPRPDRPSGRPAAPFLPAGSGAHLARLVLVRVRLLELRLLAVCLAILWALVAAFLLVGYRPGGPVDLLVGIAALVPLGVALAAVAWPPAARSGTAFRLIGALGVATIIILLPVLGGLVQQLVERGLQTLLPSPETAYPWLLAIVGTSVFASLGLARRILGPESRRPRRFGVAIALGVGLAAISGTALAGATVANEVALRNQPAAASRYGPTDPALLPPACDAPLSAGSTAQLTLDVGGTLDGRSLGTGRVRGSRSGDDFRWLAEVTTTREIGFAGAALLGQSGWVRAAGTRWAAAPVADVRGESLDLAAIDAALEPLQRTAAEDRGLTYVEGARARRCRIAVDGATFRRAFPQVRWLVGETDLATWRDEIDYWVFADGQVGRIEGRLGGPGFGIQPDGVRAELTTTLTATDRGGPVTILPPLN
jgi:hypothetical protein